MSYATADQGTIRRTRVIRTFGAMSQLTAPPPTRPAAAGGTTLDHVRPAAASLRSVVKTSGVGDRAVRALDDVSISFEVGAFTAIMGPSGSGKSTLLNVLAGLDRVDDGMVEIGGVDIGELNDRDLTRLRRRRLGFVFQSFNLMPALSAHENIVLPKQLDRAAVDADELTGLVERLGLSERLGHRPGELSGGQQQRVAVARALLGKPDLVVCDEPTGALDSTSGAEVLSALRTATTERHQTVVMVTHDPAAAAYADRVVIVRDGRITHLLDTPTVDSIVAFIADDAHADVSTSETAVWS